MRAIVIPDYYECIDRRSVLTYTENNEMIPERAASAMCMSSRRRNCHRLTENSFKAAIWAAFFVQKYFLGRDFDETFTHW